MPPIRALALLLAGSLAMALPAGPVQASEPHLSLRPVLDGYDRPVLVTSADGTPGTMFVAEQGGRIERAVWRTGRWQRAGTVLDISDRVDRTGVERGLLGAAFHPRFEANGRFYVAYTRSSAGSPGGESVVSEFRATDGSWADPGSERIIMVIAQPGPLHNVGHLAFGPDGLLYVGVGDGGLDGDPAGWARSRSSLLGSILRIDPADPDGPGPLTFTVPPDNPFVDEPGLDALWATGLRNPWRFSFDPATGDLWIGDVGRDRREEVDRAPAGAAGRDAGRGLDFGWSDCEGALELASDEGDADLRCATGTPPLFEYAHGAGACAVVGGHVLRGAHLGAWQGLYVAADYCGRLFALDADGRVRSSNAVPQRITSFGQDAEGAVFAADGDSGLVYRLEVSGHPHDPDRFEDRFDRELEDGWGWPDVGSPWDRVTGAAVRLSVDGSAGRMEPDRRGSGGVLLRAPVRRLDSDVLASVSWSAAHDVVLRTMTRYQDGRTHYGTTLRAEEDGSCQLALEDGRGRLLRVVDVELPCLPAQRLWWRTRTFAREPTIIASRVWSEGTPEPDDWLLTWADADPALQGSGDVAFESDGSASVAWHEISITTPAGPRP